MNRSDYYYISYDIDEIKDVVVLDALKSDQSKIDEILDILCESEGKPLKIIQKPIGWHSYKSIFFYLKLRHLVIELEYCDRRFRISGARAKNLKDFLLLRYEHRFIFKDFHDYLMVYNLNDFFNRIEAIL